MSILSFKVSGFDELRKELTNLQKNAERLSGTHQVPLNSLLTAHFMRKNTDFSDFDSFLNADGFGDKYDDFKAIPDDKLDNHVSSHSNFDSWDEMLNAATKEYISKELGF